MSVLRVSGSLQLPHEVPGSSTVGRRVRARCCTLKASGLRDFNLFWDLPEIPCLGDFLELPSFGDRLESR